MRVQLISVCIKNILCNKYDNITVGPNVRSSIACGWCLHSMLEVAPALATYLFVLTDVSSTYCKNVYIKIVYKYFVNIKLKVE